ncbi:MAG: T9SS type A sorting domain-containing protein [Bacteroidales bacterium]|nr:T9SS type A sorting domain-containing protein [Bacteroidales bacterium]
MKKPGIKLWKSKYSPILKVFFVVIFLNFLSGNLRAECTNNWSGDSPSISFQRDGNILTNFSISLNDVGCFSSVSFTISQITLGVSGASYNFNAYPNSGNITINSYTENTMSGTYYINLAYLHPMYGYPVSCGSTSGSWSASAETPHPVANAGPDVAVCSGETVTLTGSGGENCSWSGGVDDGLAFIPSETTTFTLTVTNADGCTDTDEIKVIVNPLPTADAGSDTSVCAGESLILTATGGVSYSWSGGVDNGLEFFPAETSTYTVTVTSADGCADNDEITVSVNPLPTADAGSDTSVCAGESLTLTATGGESYSWSGGVSNGIAFIPTETITYTVWVTSAEGCTNTDEVTVEVDDCTFINETENTISKVRFYPNPTYGEFTVSGETGSSCITVTLISMDGKVVFSKEYTGLPGLIDEKIRLANLNKGVYFILMNNGLQSKYEKIIIE